MSEPKNSPTVAGEASVRAKTGKSWEEWFTILDLAGAAQMDHPEIARYLKDQHSVPDWWCQNITVAYEQARGRRVKHQTTSGFQISASRTISAPVERLYQAWQDEQARASWLKGGQLEIRKETPNKIIRADWVDGSGKTNLEIYFTAKEGGRSQVSIQHNKLPGRQEAERMKGYWKTTIDRLQAYLEQDKG